MCGGVKQRGKKKKKEGEERNMHLDEKKDNGKNKIKNNKKLKLRNVTIKF